MVLTSVTIMVGGMFLQAEEKACQPSMHLNGVKLDGQSAELFVAALALQKLVWKSQESQIIPGKWKKRMIVKISKQGIRFECDNRRGICMHPTIASQSTLFLLPSSNPEVQTRLAKILDSAR